MNYLLEILTLLNNWIGGHKELVTVVAVPLLTLVVTYLTARAAEKRAQEQRRIERQLARELKIAEFRQKWISETRLEVAEILAIIGDASIEAAALRHANTKIGSLFIRMNPSEPKAKAVFDKLMELLNFKGKRETREELRLDVINATNIYLKAEWERLKSDLTSTEISEDLIR